MEQSVKQSKKSTDGAKKTAPVTKPKGCNDEEIVSQLNDNDVLFGRGSGSNDKQGNIFFRSLVSKRKAEYLATSQRMTKARIAREIVDEVLQQKGRFLKKLEVAEAKRRGIQKDVWVVADDETTLEKVKQACRQILRDRPKAQRSNIEPSNVTSAFSAKPAQISVESDRTGREEAAFRWQDSSKQWTDRAFWIHVANNSAKREFVSIDSRDPYVNRILGSAASTGTSKADECRRRSREGLIRDGYALVDHDQLLPGNVNTLKQALVQKLRHGIEALHGRGFPASFILLFDETWHLARLVSQTLHGREESLHPSNSLNYDILAWFIEPGQAGFSPHRDRQPDDIASSFHADGQAKYVTLWMALSEASPENSCLYVIPKQHDPGYRDGDFVEEDDEDKDPLQRSLASKESYQHIRALPRQPGQSVLFTHRILHWGSRGNPNATCGPRIAISFVYSDASFEKPYLKTTTVENDAPPPFRIRLLLVCSQLLIYHQRFNLPKVCILACYDVCTKHKDDLDPTYRQKVSVEFVKAMREASRRVSTGGDRIDQPQSVATMKGATGYDEDDAAQEEEEEAVLEAMLEAEQEGYGGEIDDDYDELEEDHDAPDDKVKEDPDCDDNDDGEGVTLFGKKRNTEDGNKLDGNTASKDTKRSKVVPLTVSSQG